MPLPAAASLHPKMGRSPVNRSLERGIELLRAFRPGSEALGNGELAERSGLSRATVSRLTQTLVGTGFLQYDTALRAYRLGVPVLSLAHALRTSSAWLQAASGPMQEVAIAMRINVGLATADRDEMVYLKSVRYGPRASLRTVVEGQRVPMELTSLGRAWLAVASHADRQALAAIWRARRGAGWRTLARELTEARHSVRTQGYCVAAWQPEVLALSTPLVVPGHPVHVLNMSLSASRADAADIEARLAVPLQNLAATIRRAVS